MIDRALDRLCAYVFGTVEPIDHDAIDVLIDATAALHDERTPACLAPAPTSAATSPTAT